MAIDVRPLHAAVRRRGRRRRPDAAPRARRRRSDRGGDRGTRRPGVSRSAHHRRTATRVQPLLRRAGGDPRHRHQQARRAAACIRRSPMSPTSTRTTRSWRATTGGGCTALATCCGIPTVRSSRFPATYSLLSGRVVVGARAARPSSPTCAPPTTRWTTATKAEIEDLVCEHSLIYSREQLGFDDLTGSGTRDDAAGAPGAGADASGQRTKVDLSGVAYRHDHRLAGAGGARLHPRPDRARDAARSSSTRTNGGRSTW